LNQVFFDPADKSLWYDSYREEYVHLSAKIWLPDTRIDSYLTMSHPHSMSVGKPRSSILRTDGKVARHDMSNVCLTMVCINLLKGTDPPAVLLLLKKAMSLKPRTDGQGIHTGYASDVVDQWEVFQRVSDHNRTHILNVLNTTGI